MNRSLMMKATSSEDAPTPGYLYGEIAKMTLDGPDVVDRMVRVLCERLRRKEPVVRQKALVVIKHVCRRGDPAFRRGMRANVADVKECLQFSGPSDPLKGDQPYRAVREAAKEAVEAIFDNTSDVTPSNSALAQRIKGYGGGIAAAEDDLADAGLGSSASSGAGLASQGTNYGGMGARALPSEVLAARGFGTSGNKFGGIGNPNFKDPRDQPKGFLDRVKTRVEEYTEKASKSVATSGIQDWLGTSKAGSAGAAGPAGAESDRPRSSYQGVSLPNRGSSGPWGHSGNGLSSDPRSPRASSSSSSSSSFSRTGAAASDGSRERSLVDGLCSKGGVRAVPARDKVDGFLDACKTLDAGVVMPIVYEKLATADWKVQHKALCVCEALLQAGDAFEAYADYIDEHAEVLEQLQGSSQPTLRNRCKKVWVLLYGEEPASEAAAASTESAPRGASGSGAKHETDLLFLEEPDQSADGGDGSLLEPQHDLLAAAPAGQRLAGGPANGTRPQQPTAPMPSSSTSGGGMFNSLQVKSAAAPKADDSVDSLLFDGEAKETHSADSGADDLSSQLDGLAFNAMPNQTLTQQQQQQQPRQAAHSSASAGTGFSFIAPTTAAASGAAPGAGAGAHNGTSALDSLMHNSIGQRQNPIPVHPNTFAARPMAQPQVPPHSAMPFIQHPGPSALPQQHPFPGAGVGMNGLAPGMPQHMPMPMMYPGAPGQPQFPMMASQGGMPRAGFQPQGAASMPHMMQMQTQTPVGSVTASTSRPRPSVKANVRSGGSPATGQAPPAAARQPDKFDFVSSAMAEMK